ncbi:MAG: Fic family protein [Myxococcales bacterium]|nr:Fic family protein [Myxococcales bacterium]
MATPQEKLAESLDALKRLQEHGLIAIRSTDLTRVQRERLSSAGFLREVMKGWYVAARPDEDAGESTSWYTSFWAFCAQYLRARFGDDWCLAPEQSLSVLAGNRTVPRQLVFRAPGADNKPTSLPYNTSLFGMRASLPDESDTVVQDGLRMFSLPAALLACSSSYFEHHPTDARAALSMVRDASTVLEPLLAGGHSTIAGRLAGAFRDIGRDRIAVDIVATMQAAGYSVRESTPFASRLSFPTTGSRTSSPHVARIRLMWAAMRGKVPDQFPDAPGLPDDSGRYLQAVADAYVTDAYHSLSIEGYRVSPQLIERVRSGDWKPDTEAADRNQRDALAARGYFQAYQAVRDSLRRVLGGDHPGLVADEDHGIWYRQMFAPSVHAGLIEARDLAGYRNAPVYIRRSKHVPPSPEAVRDALPALYELLAEEPDPAVRVVLGHFVFVYIHPYMDGNGRMGRFVMNLMLAGGGYPWTVVPLERRDTYMQALESASADQDIVPFARFVGELVAAAMEGHSIAHPPIR